MAIKIVDVVDVIVITQKKMLLLNLKTVTSSIWVIKSVMNLILTNRKKNKKLPKKINLKNKRLLSKICAKRLFSIIKSGKELMDC